MSVISSHVLRKCNPKVFETEIVELVVRRF